MKKLWPVLCALALLLGLVRRVSAHDLRGTAIFLDVGDAVVEAQVELPIDQLGVALGAPAAAPGATPSLLATEAELRGYVLGHLSAAGQDGRPFTVEIASVRVERVGDGDCAVARATLRPPPGSSARWLELRADPIVHLVPSHNIYVFVRRDLRGGALGEAPEPAGMMHYQKTRLVVDRSGGSAWRGMQAVFSLGMKHIAEGTDHLLFLFLLLLSAPLVARDSRWERSIDVRRSLRGILGIVTAFTAGHSLTLAVVVITGATLPSRPVESMIAVSILISAVHAARPLFAGREPIVAGLFGLIHGLGFAGALSGFGFDGPMLPLVVLGFNLGVEVMQLVIVALAMPWLVLASRNEHFRALRLGGALFGYVAAMGWIGERAFGWSTPVPAIVEAVAARAVWLLAALVGLSVATVGSFARGRLLLRSG